MGQPPARPDPCLGKLTQGRGESYAHEEPDWGQVLKGEMYNMPRGWVQVGGCSGDQGRETSEENNQEEVSPWLRLAEVTWHRKMEGHGGQKEQNVQNGD